MTADPIAAWLQPLLDLDAINAEKARAVVEFMDCAPEREAELLAVIRKPAQGALF
jgi:hypothetical protein